MILDIIATVFLAFNVLILIKSMIIKDIMSGTDVLSYLIAMITFLLPIYCIWR